MDRRNPFHDRIDLVERPVLPGPGIAGQGPCPSPTIATRVPGGSSLACIDSNTWPIGPDRVK